MCLGLLNAEIWLGPVRILAGFGGFGGDMDSGGVWWRAGLLVAEILGKLRFPYRFLDFGNASELALPKSASRWSPVLFF